MAFSSKRAARKSSHFFHLFLTYTCMIIVPKVILIEKCPLNASWLCLSCFYAQHKLFISNKSRRKN